MPANRKARSADASSEISFSDDRAPRFRVRLTGGRISVERRSGESTRSLTQYAEFDAESSFEEWCEADEVRFTHPLLHQRLKQAVQALLKSQTSNGAEESG